MKKVRSILSVFIAAVMMFTLLGVSAFAKDSYTITINNEKTGHEYAAYQIFKGDLSDKTLSNVEWGEGVDGAALLEALKADELLKEDFKDCETAADAAEKLATFGNDSAKAQKFGKLAAENKKTVTGTSNFAESKYTIGNLPAGYYFVEDTKNPEGLEDAYTRYIMDVVRDVEVEPKSVTTTVEKEVKEGEAWQKLADASIGEEVEFRLTATVPANAKKDYDTYKLIFHDTLSKGLTYKDIVSVNVNDVEDLDLKANFEDKGTGEKGVHNFDFTIEDVIEKLSDKEETKISIIYKATVNTDAIIGKPGNPNEVYLEYSNNPNGEELGRTANKKAVVFTYKLDGNKIDGKEKEVKLKDAEFVLKNEEGKFWTTEGNWVASQEEATVVKSDGEGKFAFTGLDEGAYTLIETKAPVGYNTAKDTEFTVTREWIDANKEDGTYTELKINDVAAANLEKGVLAIDVENFKGSILPSTGGKGTVMLYIGGAILIAAGAVYLYMDNKKKAANK